MASFEYQHSILYKGENPATAQFVPKNREKQQNRTFRHRAGAEPAFLKKELEEQERQQEQEERIKRQNALLQAQQQSRGLRAAADHLRAERHHGSSTSAPSKPPAHARQKVYGGVAQTRVTEVASRTINETVHDRIAKRQKLQAAVELDDDSDDGGGTGDEADRPDQPPLAQPLLPRPGRGDVDDDDDDSASDSEDSEVAEDAAQKRRIALERARKQAELVEREKEDREKEKESRSSSKVGGIGGTSTGAGLLQLEPVGGAAVSKVLDDSDSDTSSSSDSDGPGAKLAKPVFVPKGMRATEREKAAKVAEEQMLEQENRILKKQKKEDAKRMVAERVAQEDIDAINEDRVIHSESEYSLDSDEDETAESMELWKIRELERVLSLQKLRTQRIEEFERLEKRRQMTDLERQEDDERMDKENPLMASKAEKSQFGFMQKYHHQGGYFMDKKMDGSEMLYRRDVNQALDSEKFDKQLLPASMQVRRGNFGFKGQVKHKSLKEADTTDWTSAWVDPKVRERRELFEKQQQDQQRMRDEKLKEMRKMGER
ncbi:unnamed protein product [Amoebophrya sp. A120]|nr:unnamed protein product [Amoebophrya sp. A120]|eukprot:GSA120T00000339001.1